MLQIFKNDAFSVTSLTHLVNTIPDYPTRLRTMPGLFDPEPITTTHAALEFDGTTIRLVAPTPRGGPGETRDYGRRTMRLLQIPHFQRDWSVIADEVQGVREAGSETQLRTVQGLVAKKVGINKRDLIVTDEVNKLGAIGGIITYADGTTLNLFTELGVTAPAEITFNLTGASTGGPILKSMAGVIRAVKKAVGGLGFGYIHALCGDDFFDALLTSEEVRETYKNTSKAEFLRSSYVGPNRGSNPIYEFGGIVFENYGQYDVEKRTAADTGLIGVGPKEVRFIPVGVPDLFKQFRAPADYISTVNTLGEEFYAKQWEMPNEKGINGEVQTNVLNVCTRPSALLKGKIN